MKNSDSADTCGRCQLLPPAFDRCISVFQYEKPLSNLITEFKYHGSTAKGHVLAQLLAQAFVNHYRGAATGQPVDCPHAATVWPGLLIPVPLHPNRLKSRGFNQALLLACSISRLTGIPVASGRLKRTRDTDSQSRLHARQRRKNLQRAFQAVNTGNNKELDYVAVIDDVVTTTATANAVARVLRAEGASRIDVWALARA
ncbi:MAG: ComF family protein [Gammaproteobacteria bacterium]